MEGLLHNTSRIEMSDVRSMNGDVKLDAHFRFGDKRATVSRRMLQMR